MEEQMTLLPPLREGERLTRAEFHCRYAAMPHLKRAELIDGQVYIPTLGDCWHGEARADLCGFLAMYRIDKPPVEAAIRPTIILDDLNEPQPDLTIFLSHDFGGTSFINSDGFIEGPPELIGEVVPDHRYYALHEKMDVFARSGVQEYVVWRVMEKQVDVFHLRERQYRHIRPDSDGLVKSKVFPGLWIDVLALQSREARKAFEVVQQGTASPENAAFVERLKGLSSGDAPWQRRAYDSERKPPAS
jgi:Uma2 family endonuclease